MKFPFQCLPKGEIMEVEITNTGAIPGNGVAICPICQEELHGMDYIWKCKGKHAYSGPLLWK